MIRFNGLFTCKPVSVSENVTALMPSLRNAICYAASQREFPKTLNFPGENLFVHDVWETYYARMDSPGKRYSAEK
jgi:hypothetical protein